MSILKAVWSLIFINNAGAPLAVYINVFVRKVCISLIYPREKIISSKTWHISRLNFKKTSIVFIERESYICKSVFLYTASLGTCLVKVKFCCENTAVLSVYIEGLERVMLGSTTSFKSRNFCLLYVSFMFPFHGGSILLESDIFKLFPSYRLLKKKFWPSLKLTSCVS